MNGSVPPPPPQPEYEFYGNYQTTPGTQTFTQGQQPQQYQQQIPQQANPQIGQQVNQQINQQMGQPSMCLRLCFCPLCDKQQMLLQQPQPFQWLFIARVIMFSLKRKMGKQDFFTINRDVLSFVVDHWYFFQNLEQFRAPQEQWVKTLNEQFNNKDFFTLSDDKGAVKINNDVPPWDYDGDVVQEISASSHVDDLDSVQNTEQIQAELKESYMKTLQIAKVAYLTCQKALYVYTDDNSKNNVCFL
ncbi:hypothetical protein EIN_424830 [Entamoeba invadens IP1]|uniref:Uncharacterized protein n=1 Tax=Entamoeba invadens IP1 TaxID=370355 RepID=A0A0A1U9A0_ENTIV|nr:hypothetical protein EIN_424830 [Entamoeba invadens IP1]ELP89761.1 hypothetical protein EIN_424830 [Entamoeba invadens IP1]|eukprot:XP_004256532.1 hypothetical protein EIN_424830 [Entamoeba invadens IP1]